MLLLIAAALPLQAGSPIPAPPEVLSQAQVRAGQLHDIEVLGVPGAPITFHVELEGDLRTFSLEPKSVRADGYRLIAQMPDGSYQDMEPGPVNTYRGASVDGRYRVWAGFDGQHLTASVESNVSGDTFEILPHLQLDPVYDHLVYRVEDDIAEKGECEIKIAEGLELPSGPTMAFGGGTTPLKVAELGIDCDFEFYQSNGSSIPNTEADVNVVINRVIDDHYNDTSQTNDPEITYEITAIIVRTTAADPYSSSDAGTMLNEVRNHWNSQQQSIPRDHVELFTDKNVIGNVIGVAWLSGICSTLEFSMVESKIGSLTSRASLTSHEIGHNWGADHCNSNTPCHIMCSGLGGCNGLGGDFGAFALGQINAGKAAHLFCLDDPGSTGGDTAPVVTSVSPSTVDAVIVDGGTLTLTGTGFNGTTGVTIDGVPVSSFPPDFQVIDDTTLEITLRPSASAGLKTIEVTDAIGSGTATYSISFNLTPTLDLIGSDPGFLLSSTTADIYVGSLPNDIVYLLASVSNVPSVLPSLVSLDIGNNFLKLIDLGISSVSPASGFTFSSIPLAGVPPGTKFYLQGAIISAALPSLPASATNVQSGTVLF